MPDQLLDRETVVRGDAFEDAGERADFDRMVIRNRLVFAPPRINSVCNSVVQLRRKVWGVTTTGRAKRSPGRRTRFKSVF